MFALDKSKPKIEKILRNMRNLKLTCIKPFLWDATKAVSEIEDGENVQGAVIIIFKTGHNSNQLHNGND